MTKYTKARVEKRYDNLLKSYERLLMENDALKDCIARLMDDRRSEIDSWNGEHA